MTAYPGWITIHEAASALGWSIEQTRAVCYDRWLGLRVDGDWIVYFGSVALELTDQRAQA